MTLLSKAEALAYARNEEDYQTKYADFVSSCPNERVKKYFDENWHCY
jgi:hypothetical protein